MLSKVSRWCYTRRFATTIFRATMPNQCWYISKQYCNSVATLCCAKIVVANPPGVTSPWGLNEKSCTSYHQFFVRRRKASWPEGRKKKVQPAVTFATLETRRGKEWKCVPQLFLEWLLGTRRSAIGHTFFLSLATVPEVFAKVKLDQVFFLYLVSKEANCS